jgi:hypothetical protein
MINHDAPRASGGHSEQPVIFSLSAGVNRRHACLPNRGFGMSDRLIIGWRGLKKMDLPYTRAHTWRMMCDPDNSDNRFPACRKWGRTPPGLDRRHQGSRIDGSRYGPTQIRTGCARRSARPDIECLRGPRAVNCAWGAPRPPSAGSGQVSSLAKGAAILSRIRSEQLRLAVVQFPLKAEIA